MRDYDRSPDTLEIWDKSKNGLSAKQIVTESGWKFGKVNSALRRGRDAKILEPRKVKPISSGSHHRNYMKLGSISAICKGLTDEQVDWLATQTRELGCESLAEFILELVRDAHAIDNS